MKQENKKGTWTFIYTTGGQERTVQIKARDLIAAREIFYKNFGVKTSFVVI